MKSQIAMSDLHRMRRDGLDPTPEDCVHLNAFGLELQAAMGKNAANSTYYLPRVAALSETVSFRQPAIGHEIWIEKVERFVKRDDFQSSIAIRAFALSRPVSDLPDPDSPSAFRDAVESYAETLKDFTRDQIFAALDHAIYGADEIAAEPCAVAPVEEISDDDDSRTPDGTEGQDWKHCVAAGVLARGQVVLIGATVADLSKLTSQQVIEMADAALRFRGIDTSPDIVKYQERYYNVRDEIRARLESEHSQTNN